MVVTHEDMYKFLYLSNNLLLIASHFQRTQERQTIRAKKKKKSLKRGDPLLKRVQQKSR